VGRPASTATVRRLEFKIKPYDGIVGPKTWKVLRAK
jgi:hypothetical protein